MVSNPFQFGALALDEAFTDREEELRELKADIRNGQDVVIFAPRRYGKSSLVLRAVQELGRPRVLVAQLDLMTTPTKEKLAEKLAKAIHDEFATVLFRAKDALRVFAGLRIAPVVTVDPQTGALGFSFTASARPEDVDATLERLLALPGELAGDRGRRAALVLDEFQEVVEIDPDLPKLMRAVFQAQPEVAHIYLGSKRHMLERIFNDENEPFWRSAKPMELGLIPPPLFRPYIEAQFAATGKRVPAQVADAVLATTRGHPYATQELCYFLWEQTPAGRAANPDRLEGALAAVLRSEHAHFTLVWDRATATQKVLLQALAREPGRPFSGDYRRRHDLPPPSSVQRALGGLAREELVGRDDGAYRISEPFLAEWIARHAR
ncbi:MAG TPA: ATP-binding protein [Gaiellaceae bacterium]|nr:ATP-binding protein [Gaiellaceae bacterium]